MSSQQSQFQFIRINNFYLSYSFENILLSITKMNIEVISFYIHFNFKLFIMNLALGNQEILFLAVFAALFFAMLFLLLKFIKNDKARNFVKKVYYIFIVVIAILIGVLVFNLISSTFFPTKPQIEFVPSK